MFHTAISTGNHWTSLTFSSKRPYVDICVDELVYLCFRKQLWSIWRYDMHMLCSTPGNSISLIRYHAIFSIGTDLPPISQIARFMGPTWCPPGSCRPQMGRMLAPWTSLSQTPPTLCSVAGPTNRRPQHACKKFNGITATRFGISSSLALSRSTLVQHCIQAILEHIKTLDWHKISSEKYNSNITLLHTIVCIYNRWS